MQSTSCAMPTVWLIGDVEHPDFIESMSLLRATAQVTSVANSRQAAALLARAGSPPELVVLAASRPGVIHTADVQQLRRAAPLTGVVALLGSWCEGETRSGRPAAGVGRIYWYDFPGWWRRQLAAWADGHCPEWARPEGGQERDSQSSRFDFVTDAPPQQGLVVLDTTCWETAEALGDVLRPAGFATVWTQFDRHRPQVRGATAGIWEGRQLDGREAERLAAFCRRLAGDGAPVVALADFPRRDRVERARQAGAAVVLGKPWLNDDLVATLQLVVDQRGRTAAADVARAA